MTFRGRAGAEAERFAAAAPRRHLGDPLGSRLWGGSDGNGTAAALNWAGVKAGEAGPKTYFAA